MVGRRRVHRGIDDSPYRPVGRRRDACGSRDMGVNSDLGTVAEVLAEGGIGVAVVVETIGLITDTGVVGVKEAIASPNSEILVQDSAVSRETKAGIMVGELEQTLRRYRILPFRPETRYLLVTSSPRILAHTASSRIRARSIARRWPSVTRIFSCGFSFVHDMLWGEKK